MRQPSYAISFTLAFLGVVTLASVLHFIEQHALAATIPPAAARPHIRVGLYASDTAQTITVADASTVVTVDGTRLQTIPEQQPITLSFDRTTNVYSITSGTWNTTSAAAIRIEPQHHQRILTITSYENRPTWDTSLNDNTFFGVLELQYAPATDLVWMINELGIENYVTGIAEASNDNPTAYLKALYTAARSYAYWNYLYPTKHANEPYLLDASANDQVYRGYGFTQRSPKVMAAVKATRGQLVYYNNTPALTPYFSQTDGRTRAWSEVWSGDYAYLQSVTDPCCSGEPLLGHGVGLSAKGARYFASQNHWHWREILQYYYQGITLESLWN
ncbi:MAG: hypothetical protein HYV33_04760 [Candidatus Kerfeldbacteria bacterium]|nr:hypothetical protein [Candidatus Kerfeldbacteria bacterium]